MQVDRAWLERNLGFDPITRPPPVSTFAFAAAAKPSRVPEDLQREIIDFDSEGPEGAAFLPFPRPPVSVDLRTSIGRRTLRRKPERPRPRRRKQQATEGEGPRGHLDRGRRPRLEPGPNAGQGFPRRLRPLQAELLVDRRDNVCRLACGEVGSSRRVLDDDNRRHKGGNVQIRVASVAGHEQASSQEWSASERCGLEIDHRRRTAGVCDHDRHRRRNREAIRGGRRDCESRRALLIPEMAEERSVRRCQLPQRCGATEILCGSQAPVQGERRPVTSGEYAATPDRSGVAQCAVLLDRDDGFLRLRHLERLLQAPGPGRSFRDGRRGAGHGRKGNGAESAAVDRGAKRLRSPDQGRRAIAQAASGPGRPHLQGLRALEFGVQRDRLPGTITESM